GVKLNDSLLMLPAKSISGIYFQAEASFFSCQLCPRQRCESRKAKYDPDLVREYGMKKN
ncbi:MAG: vitamin B12 dependent methionine synthase, partial [Deltaproteobacteria bacterium]|nr:vitamin B12 dependent methionine synthase [Deltaproteobacteria bacterium]